MYVSSYHEPTCHNKVNHVQNCVRNLYFSENRREEKRSVGTQVHYIEERPC